ncbi:MAG: hypothetical protein LBI16_01725 [Burkholderiales bacterium]|jgi:hypothetical protein|nr:hypothetical protein [Burkholderiales bacterium]
MLFETPDGKTRYAAWLARTLSTRPESSFGNEKKQWNVFEALPFPFQANGLRWLKPKSLLADKVLGCSMAPRLFHGDHVVIDRSETWRSTDGGEMLAKPHCRTVCAYNATIRSRVRSQI